MGDDYDKACQILIYAKKTVASGKPVSELPMKANPQCRMCFYHRGEKEEDVIDIYEWDPPTIDINEKKYSITPEMYAPIREFLEDIDWTQEGLPK